MEFAFLILTLIVCFFLLYVLSRQDFVLLRQNISLAQMLDAAIITVVASFITGRFLFSINNLEISLFHAIRFFHFVKFAGVSPLGFTLGGAASLGLLMRGRKGIFRIFDIFSISFLPLYLYSLIIKDYPSQAAIFFPGFAIVALVTLFVFFLKSHLRFTMRDGSISFILLLIVSIETLIYEYLNPDRFTVLFDLSLSQVLSIISLASGIVFLFVNQQKIKV